MVGEGLEIGDKEGLVVLVLERQAGAERSGEVAEVQRTRRSIAGEHDLSPHCGSCLPGLPPGDRLRDG